MAATHLDAHNQISGTATPIPKTIISPGQAVLILLKYYNEKLLSPIHAKERKELQEIITELKVFYLIGTEDKLKFDRLKEHFSHDGLTPYEISFTAGVINEDVSRRYFETHLAMETLQNEIRHINHGFLKGVFEALKNLLDTEDLDKLDKICQGSVNELEDIFHQEYADYITAIERNTTFTRKLTPESKATCILLLKICSICILSIQKNDATIPIPIYHAGFYRTGNRGGAKRETGDTRSTNIFGGLMRAHTPLPYDDDAVFFGRNRHNGFIKASDKGQPTNSLWVRHAFARTMHPYSNTISGTFLTFLRHIAYLKQQHHPEISAYSALQFEQLFRVFISLLLADTGGHSLFEYTYPFRFKEVKQEFQDVAGFSDINLASMFLFHNQEAFDDVLHKTIQYNETLLVKKRIIQSIQPDNGNQSNNSSSCLSLEINSETFATLEQEVEKMYWFEAALPELEKRLNHIARANQERVNALPDTSSLQSCFFRSLTTNSTLETEAAQAITEMVSCIMNNLFLGCIEEAKKKIESLKDILSDIGIQEENSWGDYTPSFQAIADMDEALGGFIAQYTARSVDAPTPR